jgi:lecithin-cholesterol acyltransferase
MRWMKGSPVLKRIILLLLAATICEASFVTTPLRADILHRELSEIHASAFSQRSKMKPLSKLKNNQSHRASSFISSGPQNICTGGKDLSKLSNAEYLHEFAQGPCTPIVAVPGLAASKLKISIDCPTLSNHHPDIMKICGWDNCFDSYFGTAPKNGYKLWIPKVGKPFSIAFMKSAKRCFTSLIKVTTTKSIDQFGNQHLYFSGTAGVAITPMGYDRTDKKKPQACGFEGIKKLGKFGGGFHLDSLNEFEFIYHQLKHMGYVPGLTAQALPYDWRFGFRDNRVAYNLKRIITEMSSISGKKVSIIAHSYGSLNSLNLFLSVDQSWKDENVMRFVAIAPPFLGSSKIVASLLGGNSDYYKGFGVGIDFDTFSETFTSYPSIYDLLPRATLEKTFGKEAWMLSIKNRIAEEKGKDNTLGKITLSEDNDIVSRLFPPLDKDCYIHPFTKVDLKCKIGLSLLYSYGEVNGEKITTESLRDVLDSYSYYRLAASLYENVKTYQVDLAKMDNPGVEVVIIYTGINQSPQKYFYDVDPTEFIKTHPNEFVEPNREKTMPGDGSVMSASAIIPGIKWAYEHLKSRQVLPHAKPVTFVELCSLHNRRATLLKADDKFISSSEHIGIPCECETHGNTEDCNHIGLFNDKYFVNFISSTWLDNQKPRINKKFDNASQEVIDGYRSQCSLITGFH